MNEKSFWKSAREMDTGHKILAILLLAVLLVFGYNAFTTWATSGFSLADLWLYLAFGTFVAVCTWFFSSFIERVKEEGREEGRREVSERN